MDSKDYCCKNGHLWCSWNELCGVCRQKRLIWLFQQFTEQEQEEIYEDLARRRIPETMQH